MVQITMSLSVGIQAIPVSKQSCYHSHTIMKMTTEKFVALLKLRYIII